ncbi:hypothetical protein MBLNU457_7404t1 [Dothideomycetes sp. NU457]
MTPVSVATMQASKYDQSLQSSALELKYERSNHLVDIITKDEGIRKLRFEVHVLEDDCDELRDLLAKEEDRSDKLERIVKDNLTRAEEAEAALTGVEDEMAAREQELSMLRAERNALKNLTTDTDKVLTEKLALTHELSMLKPELEHLRAQVSTNETLLTEKLALQRQVSTIEVELEQAKRDAQRALAKRRNTMHEVAQEDEMDGLRKSLKQEKRQREKAEAALEELRVELEEQKKAAQRATVQEMKKAEADAEVEVRSEELSRELAQEKKEKFKVERAMQKAQNDWDAQRAVLEDKLTQFRNKLRTTKTQLQETQQALGDAQEQAATAAAVIAATKPEKKATAPKATAAPKQTKKRSAVAMDSDATTLGTPGNGPANKRSRKVANLGEKSSFSITPFLNRTSSIAPNSPEEEAEEEAEQDAAKRDRQPSPEVQDSPTAKPAKTKKVPLQEVPASKSNIKKAPTAQKKDKIKLTTLEQVVEEEEPASQPKEAAPIPLLQPKQQAPKPKVRKSLATFATFNFEPEAEKKVKKRKLGGLGKTLFDEEDDAPSKALPSKGLFAGGRLGPLGGLGAVRGSFLGGISRPGLKKGVLATEDGFMFSPLKKQRREMSFVQ